MCPRAKTYIQHNVAKLKVWYFFRLGGPKMTLNFFILDPKNQIPIKCKYAFIILVELMGVFWLSNFLTIFLHIWNLASILYAATVPC